MTTPTGTTPDAADTPVDPDTPDTPDTPDAPDTPAWPSNTGPEPAVEDALPGEAPPPDANPDAGSPPAGSPPVPPPSGPVGGGWPAPASGPPPAPGAVAVDDSVRRWALLAHLAGLVATSIGGLGFLGPLVVWLVKRDDHPFIAHHAAEALNFQLSFMFYLVLAGLASLPVITLVVTVPVLVVGAVLWVLLPILGAVKASRGESYVYPLTIGFVRS